MTSVKVLRPAIAAAAAAAAGGFLAALALAAAAAPHALFWAVGLAFTFMATARALGIGTRSAVDQPKLQPQSATEGLRDEPVAPTDTVEANVPPVAVSEGGRPAVSVSLAEDIAFEVYDVDANRAKAHVIVPAGRALPFSTSYEFATVVDDQKTLDLKILQGLAHGTDDDLDFFRTILSTELRAPPGSPSGTAILLTTTVDVAGTLTIEAMIGGEKSVIVQADLADLRSGRVANESLQTRTRPEHTS